MKLQTLDLPKFKCGISNKLLSNLLDIAASSEFKDFRIDVTYSGFKFKQMDASHVSLIQGRIDTKSFENYNVMINGHFVVTAKELRNVLKVFGKNDILNISCDIESKLVISVNDFTLEYKLFDLWSADTMKVPKLYYDTEFDIEKVSFYKNLVKVAKFNDYLVFYVINPTKTIPSRVDFIIKNNLGDDTVQRVSFTAKTEFYHHPDYSFKIAFHMAYLLSFIKYLPQEKIFFKMSRGMPLFIKAKLDKNSFVQYWLAPRIIDNPKEYD